MSLVDGTHLNWSGLQAVALEYWQFDSSDRSSQSNSWSHFQLLGMQVRPKREEVHGNWSVEQWETVPFPPTKKPMHSAALSYRQTSDFQPDTRQIIPTSVFQTNSQGSDCIKIPFWFSHGAFSLPFWAGWKVGLLNEVIHFDSSFPTCLVGVLLRRFFTPSDVWPPDME